MNVLIVSHGDFAKGLCNTLSMFFNNSDASYISLSSEGVEQYSKELQNYLEKTSGEILILCDLQGGTPFNQAVNICAKLGIQNRTEIVAGVNLPMLLELYALKDTLNIKSVKLVCENAGKNGIASFIEISNKQDDDF